MPPETITYLRVCHPDSDFSYWLITDLILIHEWQWICDRISHPYLCNTKWGVSKDLLQQLWLVYLWITHTSYCSLTIPKNSLWSFMGIKDTSKLNLWASIFMITGSVPPIIPLAAIVWYGQTPPTTTVRCLPDGCQDEGWHIPLWIAVNFLSVPGHIDVREENWPKWTCHFLTLLITWYNQPHTSSQFE